MWLLRKKKLGASSSIWDSLEEPYLLFTIWMDKRGDDACILLMNVLKEGEKYRDKRLVENFVVTSVMEYVRIYGMENTDGMVRIFRKRVHRADYVAEYQRVYDANKVLFKGQPAVPFTFKDITGKSELVGFERKIRVH